jgi:hypothetical protein
MGCYDKSKKQMASSMANKTYDIARTGLVAYAADINDVVDKTNTGSALSDHTPNEYRTVRSRLYSPDG